MPSMPQSSLRKTIDQAVSTHEQAKGERIRATALHHANLIQERKDAEAKVLTSLETLLDLPSTSNADPQSPSAEDVTQASELLGLFQPQNYEDLIEERNINGMCGYVLCPRPNRKQDTRAPYRLVRKAREGANVVKTGELEKWCSEDCALRAQYLRVQLDEEPLWARAVGQQRAIKPLRGSHMPRKATSRESALVHGVEDLQLDSGYDTSRARARALALERGESDTFDRASELLDITENRLQSKQPSEQFDRTGSHEAVEGYTPGTKRLPIRSKAPGDEQEDVLDTI